MKRTLAFLMAMVLVLALATMAFGDQVIGTESATTGTVTITNATVGETYQGYRIFNATVARSDNGTAATPGDDTSSGINYTWAGTGSMPTNSYFEADASGNITATAAAGSGEGGLSAGAIELIKSWIGADNSTYSFPATAATAATDATMKFAGLDYGYWYFTSTLGTLVTINSTNPNATVTDKNEAPTIDKMVKEDSSDNFGKQNDAEYGQTVEFQTTINAKTGAKNYVLFDKMDSNLEFAGIDHITIVLNDSSTITNVPATETVNEGGVDVVKTNWTATTGGTYPEGGTATFNIVFDDYLLSKLTTGYKIIVDYKATVKDSAAVNTAILNDTVLQFGNNQKTAQSETHTFVWGAKVVKFTGSDAATGTKLPGAEFVIARHGTVSGVNGHYFATFDANNKFTGWSAFVPETTLSEAAIPTTSSSDFATTYGATVLTTNASGEINVSGLDEGPYKLIETKAPAGYNKLTAPRDLVITTTGDYSQIATALTSGTNGITEVNVQNNAGTVLPSTGGIGTTLFYIIGGLLVVGAVVVLIVRKRMD